MVYIRMFLMIDMQATDFYSFVLPLGVLIAIVVSLLLYFARKQESLEKRWDRLTRAYMKYRLEQEKTFAEELEKLQILLQEKSIDQDTYVRLKKLHERALTRRLERLSSRMKVKLQAATKNYDSHT
jgi:uncharacterized membrane protein (DUF106 family)